MAERKVEDASLDEEASNPFPLFPADEEVELLLAIKASASAPAARTMGVWMTTISFQGTRTVRLIGWKGLRWNCNVTIEPPFTRMSNLNNWYRALCFSRKMNNKEQEMKRPMPCSYCLCICVTEGFQAYFVIRGKKGMRIDTHHPSGLVSVNPNWGSVATDILIPVRPLASGVTTRPRITETRLFVCLFSRGVEFHYCSTGFEMKEWKEGESVNPISICCGTVGVDVHVWHDRQEFSRQEKRMWVSGSVFLHPEK